MSLELKEPSQASEAPAPRLDPGPLRVALLGLGTVGRSVAARLVDAEWRAGVEERGFTAPRLVAVGVRDPGRDRGIPLPDDIDRTDALDSLAGRQDVDVVVELVGGTDDARRLVLAALEGGRSVVTANKKLLARHGAELEAAARRSGAALRFEAAVAGGIPVLGPLVRELAASRIEGLRGIVNGTTNFILSAMAEEAGGYDEVLRDAQARGYAEADPAGDVEADDAAHKLAILIRLAFGGWPDEAAIRRAAVTVGGDGPRGITGVRAEDVEAARHFGLAIKLVARAERSAGGVLASVVPTAVPLDSPIGSTNGVTNIVEVTGFPVGTVSLRGPGAGGDATSSSVLADLLALARGDVAAWAGAPDADVGGLRDPLGVPVRWFLRAPEVTSGRDADPSGRSAAATPAGGHVTPEMTAREVRNVLAPAGVPADRMLYPVLAA